MHFQTYIPGPPLRTFVDSFWNSTYSQPDLRIRILPRGTAELVINLSQDEIRVYDSEPPNRCRRFPGIVFSGAYGGALDLDPMQNASMIGVHFRPGGAYPFFGAVIGELTDQHISLDVLWGVFAQELRETLCIASTFQERFQLLEAALLARLAARSHHPAVSLAIDIFGATGTGDSVSAVAKRVGLSQRRLIQLFTSQVGLKPKLYSRILRFQHARTSVASAKPNWSRLALDCGYYDQSHLIQDFEAFCGLSPTDYFRLPGNQLLPPHIRVLG